MGFRFCSELAKRAGEPLEASAPEKEACVFIPRSKKEWHRDDPASAFSLLSPESQLRMAVSKYDKVLLAFFESKSHIEGHIILCEPGRLRTFSTKGDKSDLQVEAIYATCTDGKRDPCCARFGNFVADKFALVTSDSDHSYSIATSHLGGCRFAASTLCFPSGNAYGRIEPDDVAQIVDLESNQKLFPDIFRGSIYESELQCWIMKFSMKFYEFVPMRDETEVANIDERIVVTLRRGSETTSFTLKHIQQEYEFYSGCKHVDSKRRITRSTYSVVSS